MAAFQPIARQAMFVTEASGGDDPAAKEAAAATRACFMPTPRNGDPVPPESWSAGNTQEAFW